MRTERHFTLIEIIVAFAILSLIATLTGTVLFSVQQSWSKVKENTALLEDMVKLDRIANNVFRNAIPFHWPDENNKNKQIFKGRSDSLRLAYLHRINSEHENGIRFIELFLHENKLVTKYRDYPMTEENCNTEFWDAAPEIYKPESFFDKLRVAINAFVKWFKLFMQFIAANIDKG